MIRFILEIFKRREISKIINFGSSAYKRNGKKFRVGQEQGISDMDFLIVLKISNQEFLEMKEALRTYGIFFQTFSPSNIVKGFILLQSSTGCIKNIDLKITTEESILNLYDKNKWSSQSVFPML